MSQSSHQSLTPFIFRAQIRPMVTIVATTGKTIPTMTIRVPHVVLGLIGAFIS